MRNHPHNYSQVQLQLWSPHSYLGMQFELTSPRHYSGDLFWLSDMKRHLANSILATRGSVLYYAPTIPLLLSQSFPHTADAFVAHPSDRQKHPSSLVESEAFVGWKSRSKVAYLAIHDAKDAVGTALSVLNHLGADPQAIHDVHQFFEFREWDSRYNSAESMLCAFLAELSSYNILQGILARFGQDTINCHAWSRQHLLSTFRECLSHLNTRSYSPRIVWVLVNFDERIHSYQWLLSNICDLTSSSELGFTMVIVKRYRLEPGPHAERFEHIKLGGLKIKPEKREVTQDTESENETNSDAKAESATDRQDEGREQEHAPTATQGKPAFPVDTEIMELIVETPSLYSARGQLCRLVLDCDGDVELRQLIFAWLRLKAGDLSPSDLEQQLRNLYPLSAEKVFSRLWISLSGSPESRQQTTLATELLLHSFRPFTVTELCDLEERTSYGEQICRTPGVHYFDRAPNRTLSLLPGVVVVRQNEVQFRHAQFRDFLASQAERYNREFVSVSQDGARHAHARIAGWCLEYIDKATARDWSQLKTTDEHVPIPESRENFLSYAVKYWVPHVKMAGGEVDDLPSVHKFLNDQTVLRRWAESYWSLSNLATRGDFSSVTPLAIFAEHGAETLLAIAMDRVKYPLYSERDSFRALVSAARSGHLHIVRRLLALPIPLDESLDEVLLCSFASQNRQVVRDIVEVAKKEPKQLRDPLTTLGWAAYHGLEDAVEALIPLVPQERVEEAGYLPMQLVLRGAGVRTGDSLRATQLLVAAHYPLERTPDEGEPFLALSLACKVGNPDIAVFLANTMFTDHLDSQEQQLWPVQFRTAMESALSNGNHQVLAALLGVALAKDWTDSEALMMLIEEADSKKSKCCEELISHFINVSKVSGKLQEFAISMLQKAAKTFALPIVQKLLALAGGLKPDTFSDLLIYAVDGADNRLDVIKFLEKEGFEDCKATYVQALSTALVHAVDSDNVEATSFLLTQSPLLDIPIMEQQTPLYKAAYRSNERMVKLLLKAGADPCAIGDSDKWQPIHAAFHNAKILEMLIEGGADVNAKTDEEWTALHYSIDSNSKDSVEVLLKNKAELCSLADGTTVLELAVRRRRQRIAFMLLDAGADPTKHHVKGSGLPVLHTCVSYNLLDLLKTFLLYNVHVDELDDDGNTPLNSLTSDTTVPVLKLLVNRGASLVTANAAKETPLSKAIRCSNDDITRYLITAGAKVNSHIGRYGSVLHIECFYGHPDIVKLLVETGSDINRNDPGINGTPLHTALRRPDNDEDKAKVISFLLGHDGIDLEQSSLYWGIPLNVAILCADLDVVDTLLERGSHVNAEDTIGRRPVHFALCRTLDHVKRLVGAGAGLDAIDRMGRNALHFAVVSGRLDVVEYVLDQDEGMARRNDIDGWTPLMWAVRVCGLWDTGTNEQADIIRSLLEHKVDRRAQGKGLGRVWTAYGLACYYGLAKEIVDLVTPMSDELGQLGRREKAFWKDATRGEKKAREIGHHHCSACLMVRLQRGLPT